MIGSTGRALAPVGRQLLRNLGNPHRATDGVPITRRGLIAAAVSGAVFAPVALGAEEESFKFGLTPVFLSNDLELLGHLRSYLSARIGGRVELVTRRTYQEITALLVSGQIQSAWICGYPYVQFKADLDLVATPVWHGKPLYQSYLIASADRKADDWTGLKGDVHAFSDPDSNSGFLVTRALLAENRQLAGSFFARSFFHLWPSKRHQGGRLRPRSVGQRRRLCLRGHARDRAGSGEADQDRAQVGMAGLSANSVAEVRSPTIDASGRCSRP